MGVSLKSLHNWIKTINYESLSVRCLWLRFLWHYAQCFVCRSISVFKFDLLHGRKRNLTRVRAFKCRAHLQREIFQFGKSIFADKFAEAVYSLI